MAKRKSWRQQPEENDPSVTANELERSLENMSVDDPEESLERIRRKESALHDLWIVLGLGD